MIVPRIGKNSNICAGKLKVNRDCCIISLMVRQLTPGASVPVVCTGDVESNVGLANKVVDGIVLLEDEAVELVVDVEVKLFVGSCVVFTKLAGGLTAGKSDLQTGRVLASTTYQSSYVKRSACDLSLPWHVRRNSHQGRLHQLAPWPCVRYGENWIFPSPDIMFGCRIFQLPNSLRID